MPPSSDDVEPPDALSVRGPYARLPEPTRLDELIESKDDRPAPDPTAGRDPERDFVLRYAG
jgi:hypothetical protein